MVPTKADIQQALKLHWRGSMPDTASIGTLINEKCRSRTKGPKTALPKLCSINGRNVWRSSDGFFGLALISQMNCRLVDTRIDGRCVDVYAV